MKSIFKIFTTKRKAQKLDQKSLLEFVNDVENIKSAALGSMEKRLELIKRAHTL